MGMFQGDLAFTVELIAIALGLFFLHYAKKEKAKEVKLAAYILIIGGILTAACTGFYLTKYWSQGAYSTLTSSAPVQKNHMMGERMTISPKDCYKLKEHMKKCEQGGNCYENVSMMRYCNKFHHIHMGN